MYMHDALSLFTKISSVFTSLFHHLCWEKLIANEYYEVREILVTWPDADYQWCVDSTGCSETASIINQEKKDYSLIFSLFAQN